MQLSLEARRLGSLFLLLIASIMAGTSASGQTSPPIPGGDIRVHYFRPTRTMPAGPSTPSSIPPSPTTSVLVRSVSQGLTASASTSMSALPRTRRTLASSSTRATPKTPVPTSTSTLPHKATSSGSSPAATPCSPHDPPPEPTPQFPPVTRAFTTIGPTATTVAGASTPTVQPPIRLVAIAPPKITTQAMTATVPTSTWASPRDISALSSTTAPPA